jgi:hypothetical protein
MQNCSLFRLYAVYRTGVCVDRLLFSSDTDDAGRYLIGCLELDGGRQIWCHQEFLSFGAPIPETLVDDTLVLCLGAPGCEVMGLDPASGRARWRRKHAKGLSEVATVQGGGRHRQESLRGRRGAPGDRRVERRGCVVGSEAVSGPRARAVLASPGSPTAGFLPRKTAGEIPTKSLKRVSV